MMKPLATLMLFIFLSVAGNSHATSLDEAVSQVQKDTGGRILSAETKQRDGKGVHRIKVLTPDKKVRVIKIPANGK